MSMHHLNHLPFPRIWEMLEYLLLFFLNKGVLGSCTHFSIAESHAPSYQSRWHPPLCHRHPPCASDIPLAHGTPGISPDLVLERWIEWNAQMSLVRLWLITRDLGSWTQPQYCDLHGVRSLALDPEAHLHDAECYFLWSPELSYRSWCRKRRRGFPPVENSMAPQVRGSLLNPDPPLSTRWASTQAPLLLRAGVGRLGEVGGSSHMHACGTVSRLVPRESPLPCPALLSWPSFLGATLAPTLGQMGSHPSVNG